MLILIIGAVVLLALDLITKAVFIGEGFALIPGLLSVLPTRNFGAAFGIFQDTQVFLIIFTFVILAAGIVFYYKFKQGRKSVSFSIACAFALGGAVGNLVDRVILGYVRDFLNFDFMNFPVFNLADVFLNVGMVLLVVYFVFVYKEKRNDNKS